MENVIESALIRIPVKNLVLSPLNVRKKQGGGIEELAALIASQGLIHNLVVTEQVKKGKKTGKYEVVAGGRRLAALNLLVADGRLPKDHAVDCRVVEAEEALELSLTENCGREGMHPADLVMAYRNLTEAGLSPDEIAPRFGVSPLTVKRYLKLTNVSPAIFQLYANDEMNFEQISALALTEDHELQERLWNSTPEWQRNGATFRRLITETEINLRTSPLAKFVGVEAYEAAGGLIRRDLFGNEDDGYMQDAATAGIACPGKTQSGKPNPSGMKDMHGCRCAPRSTIPTGQNSAQCARSGVSQPRKNRPAWMRWKRNWEQ